MEHRPDTDAECDDTAPDDVKRPSLVRLAHPAQLRLKFIDTRREGGSEHSTGKADRNILRPSHTIYIER